MKYAGYADVVELHDAKAVISTCGDAVYDDVGFIISIKRLPIDLYGEEWEEDTATIMRFVNVIAIKATIENDILFLELEGTEKDEEGSEFTWKKDITYKGSFSVSWIKAREK